MTGVGDPPDGTALDDLGERLRGRLLWPGDSGYDDARRVWNARIDREPAAIARCAGPADVIAGVEAAREGDVPLSVKGGGHHVSGAAVCADGLTLDLSPMDWVRVDPDSRTARVGAGATVFVSPRTGAQTDPPADATAYPHRDPAHHVLVEARWTDPERDAEHEAWVREFHEALAPHANGEVEMNFLTADEPEERVRAAYGDNYDRLAALKREWDPENLFSNTQTVDPGG